MMFVSLRDQLAAEVLVHAAPVWCEVLVHLALIWCAPNAMHRHASTTPTAQWQPHIKGR